MFSRLLLLFTLVPLLEIYLLIEVGRVIGPALTIALVLGTGVLGAALARREGWRTMQALQQRLNRREVPTAELIDGGLILAAGLLLITPGLLTDLTGFILLLPPGRALVTSYCVRKLVRFAGRTSLEIHVGRRPQ